MRQTPTLAPTGWGQIDRRHFIAVSAIAVIIGLVATIASVVTVSHYTDSDQLGFFFPAAQRILDGHPFTIYGVRFGGAGTYPNYNPPISTFLIAPLLAIGQAIMPGSAECVASGYNSANCDGLLGFVGVCFIPFVILMGALTLNALRKLYPQMSQGQALLAYSLVVLSPLTWLNFTIWWHFEQPLMLCFFIAGVAQFQARKYYLAGLLLALALLTRTTAAIPLIALLVLLVAERAWQPLVKVAGTLAVVTTVGFAPFFLFDRANATYSLVTWRGTDVVKNSIWSLVSSVHSLDSLARRLDMPVAILVAIALAFLAARRFGVSAFGREAWGVLAIAALLVPMLSKSNWPYYYAEPFVFLVVWEFATLHDAPVGLWRWPVISVTYLAAAATLAQFMGFSSVGYPIVLRLKGIGIFVTMLAFAFAVWRRQQELVVAQSQIEPQAPNGYPASGYPPQPGYMQPTMDPSWRQR